MNIDLSNPPYAVKLNDLGFAYSHTDHKKGIIVYTHADPRLAGSKWIDHGNDMECIIDFEDENCMKPFSLSEHQRSHRDTTLRYCALVPGVRPARKPAIMSVNVSICAPSPYRSKAYQPDP